MPNFNENVAQKGLSSFPGLLGSSETGRPRAPASFQAPGVIGGVRPGSFDPARPRAPGAIQSSGFDQGQFRAPGNLPNTRIGFQDSGSNYGTNKPGMPGISQDIRFGQANIASGMPSQKPPVQSKEQSYYGSQVTARNQNLGWSGEQANLDNQWNAGNYEENDQWPTGEDYGDDYGYGDQAVESQQFEEADYNEENYNEPEQQWSGGRQAEHKFYEQHSASSGTFGSESGQFNRGTNFAGRGQQQQQQQAPPSFGRGLAQNVDRQQMTGMRPGSFEQKPLEFGSSLQSTTKGPAPFGIGQGSNDSRGQAPAAGRGRIPSLMDQPTFADKGKIPSLMELTPLSRGQSGAGVQDSSVGSDAFSAGGPNQMAGGRGSNLRDNMLGDSGAPSLAGVVGRGRAQPLNQPSNIRGMAPQGRGGVLFPAYASGQDSNTSFQQLQDTKLRGQTGENIQSSFISERKPDPMSGIGTGLKREVPEDTTGGIVKKSRWGPASEEDSENKFASRDLSSSRRSNDRDVVSRARQTSDFDRNRRDDKMDDSRDRGRDRDYDKGKRNRNEPMSRNEARSSSRERYGGSRDSRGRDSRERFQGSSRGGSRDSRNFDSRDNREGGNRDSRNRDDRDSRNRDDRDNRSRDNRDSAFKDASRDTGVKQADRTQSLDRGGSAAPKPVALMSREMAKSIQEGLNRNVDDRGLERNQQKGWPSPKTDQRSDDNQFNIGGKFDERKDSYGNSMQSRSSNEGYNISSQQLSSLSAGMMNRDLSKEPFGQSSSRSDYNTYNAGERGMPPTVSSDLNRQSYDSRNAPLPQPWDKDNRLSQNRPILSGNSTLSQAGFGSETSVVRPAVPDSTNRQGGMMASNRPSAETSNWRFAAPLSGGQPPRAAFGTNISGDASKNISSQFASQPSSSLMGPTNPRQQQGRTDSFDNSKSESGSRFSSGGATQSSSFPNAATPNNQGQIRSNLATQWSPLRAETPTSQSPVRPNSSFSPAFDNSSARPVFTPFSNASTSQKSLLGSSPLNTTSSGAIRPGSSPFSSTSNSSVIRPGSSPLSNIVSSSLIRPSSSPLSNTASSGVRPGFSTSASSGVVSTISVSLSGSSGPTGTSPIRPLISSSVVGGQRFTGPVSTSINTSFGQNKTLQSSPVQSSSSVSSVSSGIAVSSNAPVSPFMRPTVPGSATVQSQPRPNISGTSGQPAGPGSSVGSRPLTSSSSTPSGQTMTSITTSNTTTTGSFTGTAFAANTSVRPSVPVVTAVSTGSGSNAAVKVTPVGTSLASVSTSASTALQSSGNNVITQTSKPLLKPTPLEGGPRSLVQTTPANKQLIPAVSNANTVVTSSTSSNTSVSNSVTITTSSATTVVNTPSPRPGVNVGGPRPIGSSAGPRPASSTATPRQVAPLATVTVATRPAVAAGSVGAGPRPGVSASIVGTGPRPTGEVQQPPNASTTTTTSIQSSVSTQSEVKVTLSSVVIGPQTAGGPRVSVPSTGTRPAAPSGGARVATPVTIVKPVTPAGVTRTTTPVAGARPVMPATGTRPAAPVSTSTSQPSVSGTAVSTVAGVSSITNRPSGPNTRPSTPAQSAGLRPGAPVGISGPRPTATVPVTGSRPAAPISTTASPAVSNASSATASTVPQSSSLTRSVTIVSSAAKIPGPGNTTSAASSIPPKVATTSTSMTICISTSSGDRNVSSGEKSVNVATGTSSAVSVTATSSTFGSSTASSTTKTTMSASNVIVSSTSAPRMASTSSSVRVAGPRPVMPSTSSAPRPGPVNNNNNASVRTQRPLLNNPAQQSANRPRQPAGPRGGRW